MSQTEIEERSTHPSGTFPAVEKTIPICQKYVMYMKQTAILVGSRTWKCCPKFIV